MDIGNTVIVVVFLLVVLAVLIPLLRLAWQLVRLAWALLELVGGVLLSAAKLVGRGLYALGALIGRGFLSARDKATRAAEVRRILEQDKALGITIYGAKPGSDLYMEMREAVMEERAKAGLC